MSKFQVGDKIHLEYTVNDISAAGLLTLSRFYFDGSRFDTSKCIQMVNLNNPDIVKHIPKPSEPLRVRDQVQYKPGLSPQTGPGQGTILAFFEDRAWVAFGNLSVPLSPLIE